MARPIPRIEDLNKLAEEIKPKETKSIIDITVDTIRNKSTKNLVLGTLTARLRSPSAEPKPAVIQRPEPFKPDIFFEKPFFPSKPIPHTPKISLSSIPNPSPSITATMDKFPNYSRHLYNIPGYSAFQPVNYLNKQPAPTPVQTETSIPDYIPFTITGTIEAQEPADKAFERTEDKEVIERKTDTPKQQDFEDNFTMEIIPPSTKPDANKTQLVESKSIASIAQGSGDAVIIPTQISKSEKYSLKTSIPISKLDMKCVSSPVDTVFQNALKKPVFNTEFHKEIEKSKVERQSNIVIKLTMPNKETEVKEKPIMSDRESLKTIEKPKVEIQSNIVIKQATPSKETEVKEKPIMSDRESLNTIEKPKVEIQSNIVIKPATSKKETEVKEKPIMSDRESLKPIEKPKVEIQSNIVIKPATPNKETEVKEKPIMSDRESIKTMEKPKLEIQSNIVIKPAMPNKKTEVKEKPIMSDRESLKNIKPSNISAVQNNSINIKALINAAESINKNDDQFRVPEPKDAPKESKDPSTTQPSTQKDPKDIPPATQSTTIKSPMSGNLKAKKSSTTETIAMARPKFDPSTDESKSNPAYSAAIFRTMFIPVRPKSKPTPVCKRPMSKPVSAEASKPTISRPTFNPVSSEIKSNLTQTSATSRSKFKQASAESKPNSAQTSATTFNTGCSESKPNFPNKPPDGGYNETKNLLFLNQKNKNAKMLLTIQQNPQVLLHRTNFESKNLQAPSRLSSQSKKSEALTDTSSKVVALKRLHQDNGDENDFEKLITENQIYGNKIVVKEKSQVTQEEWKNKVNVEKPIEQDWKKQIKIDIKVDKPPENKNVVVQPNFVYLSNVQFPGNLMMIKNNHKICQTTDTIKKQISPNENITTNITVNNNEVETNTVVKNPKPQIPKEIHILKSTNNVLQTLLNNDNNKTDAAFQTNPKVILTPQVVIQMPIAMTESDNKNQTAKEAKVSVKKKDIISKQVETKSDKMTITCQVDAKVPKDLISNLIPKSNVVQEVSMLDVYEQKKRLRRLKYLSNASKDVLKPEPIPDIKTVVSTPAINVVTPDKVKAEIFREFSQTKGDENSDSESDFEEDELDEYNAIIKKYGADYNENAKADFLAGFSLASKEVFREKQLERHERTLKFDAIASAYMAAGRLDLADEQTKTTPEPQTLTTAPEAENKQTLEKQQFFAHLQLMQVSPRYKADYEKSWQCVLGERKRRDGIANTSEPFDPDDQLQILTEINKLVNDNNDLIKKRLDSICDENSDIRILAEKNFSELNRLSKMADRSVKLFSGKDTNKRDLNPGFDSENIKKFKVDPNYQSLNIPDISKIISPKTDQPATQISVTKATSMDEPSNSASRGKVRTRDVKCQADERPWRKASGVMQNFINNYREYEIGRKKKIAEYNRTTTLLRVECAHVTRAASRDSDQAQALLAELKHLAVEEAKLRSSLERITRVIDIVKNS